MGVSLVTLTVIDNSGNEGSCQSQVSVIDNNCNEDCDIPENLYATNITFFQATLGWDDVPNAIRYKAEARIKNSLFGITRTRVVSNNPFRTYHQFPFLTYEFRVKADCPTTGWTTYSDWFEFTLNPLLYLNSSMITLDVGDIPLVDLFDTENIISLFPNPTTGILQIQYLGIELDNVEISITDLSGRLIYLKQSNWTPAEIKTINLSYLSEGLYLLNLTKDEIPLWKAKVILSK